MIVLKTVAEIKAFQRKQGLVVDGIIGPKTKAAMIAADPVFLPRPTQPKNNWPKQSRLNDFYGDPRGKNGLSSKAWEKANLVQVKVPWKMVAAWSLKSQITSIRVHRNCADSLKRILDAIWLAAGMNQAKIAEWGMDLFGGGFMFRLIRGGDRLSTHAWGCAVDFDPLRNGLGDYTPSITPDSPVVAAFKAEGWVWGGDWNGNAKIMDERRPDAMHFQAARV